ncbi:BZ3500_MvSof-1268-A1-R1_Chr4-2g07060 [Microbotryum saponariae]|uniref:BZ3500_MvSof-1268-A1-R1_Chr4-2g07060 protein n=1 Tax=Microbotryum saponariae TaxID=289078 RepID=A0A2X0KZ14_9BASI|nr:BZ3500_MvSof-1268-A1-R1_Chr4-2g07060 [Microbotryum saponariae]SDA06725.1 BZ3501_MvSof-1269-A2-R1_Chr4-2g06771 [Microbotryum saponariae]
MPPRRKPVAVKASAKSTAAATTELNDDPPTTVQNRALPKKEAELFRQVLTLYENKQFTKGLETVEAILKGFPEHGEALSMRGLFLSCVDRKPEGYAEVDRAVDNDPGSHIVWHVYALMLRADSRFEQALDCYRKATTIEPASPENRRDTRALLAELLRLPTISGPQDSLNLLTDMAMLLVHLRHYTEYAQARLAILRTQPRLRKNWIYLAVAQHLASQHAEADRTLTHFANILREVPDGEFDLGEILLYHAQVLEEAGQFERCLEFLQENSGKIVDRTAYSVQRAHLLLKLGRKEPAEWAWDILLEENPDSYEFIRASVLARGADCGMLHELSYRCRLSLTSNPSPSDSKTDEGRTAAVKVLDLLAEKHPRSLAIRRLGLDLASGKEFEIRASRYLTDALSKGVPSLFADIKSLYPDTTKRAQIGQLVEAYKTSLESSSTFGLASDSDDQVESTAVYLWTLYFLAQHHSQNGDQEKALSVLDAAEAHTPSLPELSMLRARILKRSGDPLKAMQAMRSAQRLDLQDRFLNSKFSKYLIRADSLTEAEEIAGLFTKKDAPSPMSDLVDMQCLWILQEEAQSFLRQGKEAMALKRYHKLFDHAHGRHLRSIQIFTEIEEDQYDFHSYCIRKSTLRAYIDMLRFVDSLRSHPRYVAAAKGAIQVYLSLQIYLRLHDDPSAFQRPALTNGAAEAAEAEAEKERQKAAEAAAEAAKAKAEKEAKEKEEQEKAAKTAATTASKSKKGKGKKDDSSSTTTKKDDDKDDKEVSAKADEDQDPLGEKLLENKEPLQAALKFLKPLEKEAAGLVETWVLSYQVSIRRGKYLLALAALRRALSLSPLSPSILPLLASFHKLTTTTTYQTTQTPLVQKTICATLPTLWGDAGSIEAFLDSVLQHGDEKGRGERLLAIAQAKINLEGPGAKEESDNLVMQILKGEERPSLEITTRGLAYLTEQNSTQVDAYRTQAHALWPRARAFKTVSEIEAEDREVEERKRKDGEREKEAVID